MCPALLYYLAQTWAADRYRQTQHDKPARAASGARHAVILARPSRPWAAGHCGAARAHRAGQQQPMTGIDRPGRAPEPALTGRPEPVLHHKEQAPARRP